MPPDSAARNMTKRYMEQARAASLTSEQLGRISEALRGELASNDDVKRTIALGDDKYVDITNHAIERAMQRSVEEFDLVDALQNPLRTTTIK